MCSRFPALVFGGTEDWDQGDHLKDTVAKAGLDLAELDAAIDGGDHLDEVLRNQTIWMPQAIGACLAWWWPVNRSLAKTESIHCAGD